MGTRRKTLKRLFEDQLWRMRVTFAHDPNRFARYEKRVKLQQRRFGRGSDSGKRCDIGRIAAGIPG